jgi:hypothetical protein
MRAITTSPVVDFPHPDSQRLVRAQVEGYPFDRMNAAGDGLKESAPDIEADAKVAHTDYRFLVSAALDPRFV